MARFTIEVDGLDNLLNRFDEIGGREVKDDVDLITETYARKMASEAAIDAPVDTGALKNSLAASPRPADDGYWEWGSHLPYAQRQEYEHKSRKAFVRKAIWNNEQKYKDAVKRRISEG